MVSRKLTRVLALFFCSLLLTNSLRSQSCSLGPADRELFHAFFRLQGTIADDVDRTLQSDENGATQIRNEASALFGISSAEFDSVTKAGRSMRSNLDAATRVEMVYMESQKRKGLEPNLAQMKRFAEKRIAIVDSAVEQLKTSLSPAGWRGLEAYICTTLRSKVRFETTLLQNKDK